MLYISEADRERAGHDTSHSTEKPSTKVALNDCEKNPFTNSPHLIALDSDGSKFSPLIVTVEVIENTPEVGMTCATIGVSKYWKVDKDALNSSALLLTVTDVTPDPGGVVHVREVEDITVAGLSVLAVFE
jgi:hypothetical protein